MLIMEAVISAAETLAVAITEEETLVEAISEAVETLEVVISVAVVIGDETAPQTPELNYTSILTLFFVLLKYKQFYCYFFVYLM